MKNTNVDLKKLQKKNTSKEPKESEKVIGNDEDISAEVVQEEIKQKKKESSVTGWLIGGITLGVLYHIFYLIYIFSYR